MAIPQRRSARSDAASLRRCASADRVSRTVEAGEGTGPPASRVLALARTRAMDQTIVYVFISSDRDLCGLSLRPDGSDLSRLDRGTWLQHDAVPMRFAALSCYVPNPETAVTSEA